MTTTLVDDAADQAVKGEPRELVVFLLGSEVLSPARRAPAAPARRAAGARWAGTARR